MKITIELNTWIELESVLTLLSTLPLEGIQIQADKPNHLPIQKGDKSLDGKALFGIWKDKPRSIEEIRNASWTRNWNL
ncbi:MAG: hypothetical protein NW226_06305 [Microscillaceae bacterium]|nr:hypothetical protein [Microscillaceae bacterium]